jgi:acyl phosphate:glycerol-3-phosphate acyltransferase
VAVPVVIWTVLGFLSGALPFSVWLGRLVLRVDVRRYGDGNPGVANAWKAGGWRLGLAVLALDYFKGLVPVALAHFAYGISGPGLISVALAPIVGHAFSPFLGFRGGKAITVSFGVWTALLPPAGPLVLGAMLTLLHFAKASRAWTPVVAMFGLLAYLLIFAREPVLLVIWSGNTGILVWKFRRELLRGKSHPDR